MRVLTASLSEYVLGGTLIETYKHTFCEKWGNTRVAILQDNSFIASKTTPACVKPQIKLAWCVQLLNTGLLPCCSTVHLSMYAGLILMPVDTLPEELIQ